MREPESNLRYMCSDCRKEMYPRAGSFTSDEVKAASKGELWWRAYVAG